MNFEESIKAFKSRIESIKDTITTEEATKTALIMPFFQALGYDVFNPLEFKPEYTADVGIKKGEKVDYAIQLDGKPVILIECKAINAKLEKHDSQLFRYFGTSAARFAILTNGVIYRFYTDIEETNKMDLIPFLEVNLSDLKDNTLSELSKFCKDKFDPEAIFSSAEELRQMYQLRDVIQNELSEPSSELVQLFLNKDVYVGRKTQTVIEHFQPLVKKAIASIVAERVSGRLKSALVTSEQAEADAMDHNEDYSCEVKGDTKIITTEEELEAFNIVKAILRQYISVNRITYKDCETYFGINIDSKVTHTVCRFISKKNTKYIVVPIAGKTKRFDIEVVDDIFKYADSLVTRLKEIIQ